MRAGEAVYLTEVKPPAGKDPGILRKDAAYSLLLDIKSLDYIQAQS